MNTGELKRYIFENQLIEFVLKKIGNNNIKFHPNRNYYSCSNYNGDNQTAIRVKNTEYLGVDNWTRSKEFKDKSDLITLVEYNKQFSFPKAIKFLHEILGLEFKYKSKKKMIIEKNH